MKAVFSACIIFFFNNIFHFRTSSFLSDPPFVFFDEKTNLFRNEVQLIDYIVVFKSTINN